MGRPETAAHTRLFIVRGGAMVANDTEPQDYLLNCGGRSFKVSFAMGSLAGLDAGPGVGRGFGLGGAVLASGRLGTCPERTGSTSMTFSEYATTGVLYILRSTVKVWP